jgi:hypothetical protein
MLCIILIIMVYELERIVREAVNASVKGDMGLYEDKISEFENGLVDLVLSQFDALEKILVVRNKCEQCEKCSLRMTRSLRRAQKKTLDKTIKDEMKMNMSKLLDLAETFNPKSFSSKYLRKRIRVIAKAVYSNVSKCGWIMMFSQDSRLEGLIPEKDK